MKMFHLGLISTTLVIALGVSLVAPVFFMGRAEAPKTHAMISININDDYNLPAWCQEVTSILDSSSIKATVFVTGKVAENYPDCMALLASNERLDIGSQTYSYVQLPSIQDYTIQLEEVKNGKEAVDTVAKVDSRVFKAPYGITDDNIFSLLNRSNIIADFSYDDHYNKYHQGAYIWFNVTSYDVDENKPAFSKDLTKDNNIPIIINFDNHDQGSGLRELIKELEDGNIELVNASELSHLDLTVRGAND